MKRRILAVLLCLFVFCTILSACAQQPSMPLYSESNAVNDVTVHVAIVNGETTLFDGDVQVKSAGDPTAMMASQAAFDTLEPESVSTDGFVTAIAGVESDDENGWLFYHNGAMAEVGAAECVIAEGDSVEWKFVNYAEAFA